MTITRTMRKAALWILLALLTILWGVFAQASQNGPWSVFPDLSADTEDSASLYVNTEQVILDNDICSITVTGYTPYELGEFLVKVCCRNKTAYKTLMFDIDGAAVNGYMIDPLWATEVTAGNQENTQIGFSCTQLTRYGISTVDAITMALRVTDANDYSADALVNKTVTIYPTGKSSEEISVPDPVSTSQSQTFIDNELCTFGIVSTGHNDTWGYGLLVYTRNKSSDRELMFSWEDVAVNNEMMDPWWASSVLPGMRSYSTIYFDDEDLKENGITDPSSIEFRLMVSDAQDWSVDYFVDETFTYNP